MPLLACSSKAPGITGGFAAASPGRPDFCPTNVEARGIQNCPNGQVLIGDPDKHRLFAISSAKRTDPGEPIFFSSLFQFPFPSRSHPARAQVLDSVSPAPPSLIKQNVICHVPPPLSTMDIDQKYDHYDFPTKAPVEQDGHAGYLTEQQIAQVHQLRLMLEAEGFTDRLDTLTLVWLPDLCKYPTRIQFDASIARIKTKICCCKK